MSLAYRGHPFMTSTRRGEGVRLRWTHVDGGRGFSSAPSTYQLLMPNSNIYLTGLGATIFALIKQRQGSLLSSERARDELAPSQISPGATRVDTIRVLGVTLSSNLEMDIRVDTALATCASS